MHNILSFNIVTVKEVKAVSEKGQIKYGCVSHRETEKAEICRIFFCCYLEFARLDKKSETINNLDSVCVIEKRNR